MNNVISSLDVHRQLRISIQLPFQRYHNEESVFDLLLKISSFKNEKTTLHLDRNLATQKHINETFHEQTIITDNELNLPCAENRLVSSYIPLNISIKHV